MTVMRESIHLALWRVGAIIGNNQVYSHKVGGWEKAEDNISGGKENKDMRNQGFGRTTPLDGVSLDD